MDRLYSVKHAQQLEEAGIGGQDNPNDYVKAKLCAAYIEKLHHKIQNNPPDHFICMRQLAIEMKEAGL